MKRISYFLFGVAAVLFIAAATSDFPLAIDTTGQVKPHRLINFDATTYIKKAHGNLGASQTFNLDPTKTLGARSHTGTLNSTSCAWSLRGFVSGSESVMTIVAAQDGTGGRLITCADAGVQECPSISPYANSVTILTFWSYDGGTTIYSLSSFASDFTVANKSANYTTTANDSWIRHPSTDNNARTFTIDSNANVPYPIGKALTFSNEINVLTVAITTDTMTLQGANLAGSVDLAAGNVMTCAKMTATTWTCTGSSGVTHH